MTTQRRASDFDVTNRVRTTDPYAVSDEVARIWHGLYGPPAPPELARGFHDIARLYAGEYEGYHACDTEYHNLHHVLEVALAMARLMDGYERSHPPEPLGERLFLLGAMLALFHDSGYLRLHKDTRHRNGAEYTQVHVARGARLLERYLPSVGLADLVPVATRIIHFTGYEVPASRIRVVRPVHRTLGNLLGTADILAQMADRCYLEKVYDRLYPEFVMGGIARRVVGGREQIVFASAVELICKTPDFFVKAMQRLDHELAGVYRFLLPPEGGRNPYLDGIERNIEHARRIARDGDFTQLRRQPPTVVATPGEPQLV